MASLAEIRAKLTQAESRTSSNSQGGGDNAIYPHWNIAEGATSTLRFLPDSDPTNSFFWVERNMIRLPFNGIKGEMDTKQVQVQIPCIEMWGESCPILAEVRTWFKDSSLEEMGRKYWKKRSYIFQGFVRENTLADDNTPENPIRRFVMSPQIFNIIKTALMDPEMEELPTDYLRGIDFRVVKTQKGGYADYTTSTWARKETALTEVEQAAIETHGLHNLNDYLPKKPSEVEHRVMKEMFEASVDGRPYDAEKWSAYFRPYGMNAPASTGSSEAFSTPKATTEAVATPTPAVVAPVVAPVTEAVETPTPAVVAPVVAPAEAAPVATGSKAEDILAMIRSRQQS